MNKVYVYCGTGVYLGWDCIVFADSEVKAYNTAKKKYLAEFPKAEERDLPKLVQVLDPNVRQAYVTFRGDY